MKIRFPKVVGFRSPYDRYQTLDVIKKVPL